jgi:hypothetical protein
VKRKPWLKTAAKSSQAVKQQGDNRSAGQQRGDLQHCPTPGWRDSESLDELIEEGKPLRPMQCGCEQRTTLIREQPAPSEIASAMQVPHDLGNVTAVLRVFLRQPTCCLILIQGTHPGASSSCSSPRWHEKSNTKPKTTCAVVAVDQNRLPSYSAVCGESEVSSEFDSIVPAATAVPGEGPNTPVACSDRPNCAEQRHLAPQFICPSGSATSLQRTLLCGSKERVSSDYGPRTSVDILNSNSYRIIRD